MNKMNSDRGSVQGVHVVHGVQQRFNFAKRLYGEAVKAALAGHPDAVRLCTEALAELAAARAAMQARRPRRERRAR